MPRIHTVNSQTGKVFRHKSKITGNVLTFYAERGIVRIHDEETGEYHVVSALDFAARAVALHSEIDYFKRYGWPWSDELVDKRNLADCMLLVVKQCKEQGDPLEPRTLARARAESLANLQRKYAYVEPVQGADLPIYVGRPPEGRAEGCILTPEGGA